MKETKTLKKTQIEYLELKNSTKDMKNKLANFRNSLPDEGKNQGYQRWKFRNNIDGRKDLRVENYRP